MASRAVQGVAAGLLMSTMSAAVVDLEPRRPARPRRHRSTASPRCSASPPAPWSPASPSTGPPRTPCRSSSRTLTAALPRPGTGHPGPAGDLAPPRWVAALAAASGRHPGGRPTSLQPQRSCTLRRLGDRWPLPLLGAPLVGQLLGGRGHIAQGAAVTLLTGAGAPQLLPRPPPLRPRGHPLRHHHARPRHGPDPGGPAARVAGRASCSPRSSPAPASGRRSSGSCARSPPPSGPTSAASCSRQRVRRELPRLRAARRRRGVRRSRTWVSSAPRRLRLAVVVALRRRAPSRRLHHPRLNRPRLEPPSEPSRLSHPD